MQRTNERNRTPVTRGMGLPGRLVLGGTVSSGLLLGGYTVAAMALVGKMNGNGLVLTSVGLFLVGGVAGLILSAALGMVGREDGVEWREAGQQIGLGLLYAIPACLVGAVVAGWIGMAVIGLYLDRIAPILGSMIAALIAAGVMAATLQVTWASGANALRRARQRI